MEREEQGTAEGVFVAEGSKTKQVAVQVASGVIAFVAVQFFGANLIIPSAAFAVSYWLMLTRLRPREPAYAGGMALMAGQLAWMLCGLLLMAAKPDIVSPETLSKPDMLIELCVYAAALAWLFWRPGLVPVLLVTLVWGTVALSQSQELVASATGQIQQAGVLHVLLRLGTVALLWVGYWQHRAARKGHLVGA